MNSKVAELKEVFMLFDRDEDGVLSIQELQVGKECVQQINIMSRPYNFFLTCHWLNNFSIEDPQVLVLRSKSPV